MNNKSLPRCFSVAVAGAFMATAVQADIVQVNPVADTSLIQVAPNNNLGGQAYVNSGTTQNFTQNRGLFLFDPLSAIPAGSTINSVSVSFEVVGQPVDGYAPSQFGLHRVLVSWGEGTGFATSSPGLGQAATSGEATWNDRFALMATPWTAPGGAAGEDYTATPSSEAYIYDIGSSPYLFGSTADLVSDVQLWLDNPSANFGWMLIGQSESTDFTARRFASREDSIRAPILEIEYTVVPEPGTVVLMLAGGAALWRRRRHRR